MPWGFLGVGLGLLILSAAVSVRVDRDMKAMLDREDAQVLEQSERTFDGLIDQQLTHLRSQVAVLAEDVRVRSTVATPQFDEASTADMLGELKKSANADVLAILDAQGTVQSVTGADEMKNLSLGTSALIKAGLEKPSAHIWTFTNKVRLLGVAPIRLGDQVLALFMMGFDLDPQSLADIGAATGSVGGAFVGDTLVASSVQDAAAQAVLKLSASKDAGAHELVADGHAYAVRSSRPSRAAGAVKVVWFVAKHHEAARMGLLRWFPWAPVTMVGLSFWLLVGLAVRQRSTRV
jgi:hypothetical protein